jgi:hypothetical protein
MRPSINKVEPNEVSLILTKSPDKRDVRSFTNR